VRRVSDGLRGTGPIALRAGMGVGAIFGGLVGWAVDAVPLGLVAGTLLGGLVGLAYGLIRD